MEILFSFSLSHPEGYREVSAVAGNEGIIGIIQNSKFIKIVIKL